MIKSEVRRILDIISNFSQNDVKKDVLETEIISRSGLSDVEVRNYLGELEWLQIGASMGSSYWNECRRTTVTLTMIYAGLVGSGIIGIIMSGGNNAFH